VTAHSHARASGQSPDATATKQAARTTARISCPLANEWSKGTIGKVSEPTRSNSLGRAIARLPTISTTFASRNQARRAMAGPRPPAPDDDRSAADEEHCRDRGSDPDDAVGDGRRDLVPSLLVRVEDRKCGVEEGRARGGRAETRHQMVDRPLVSSRESATRDQCRKRGKQRHADDSREGEELQSDFRTQVCSAADRPAAPG